MNKICNKCGQEKLLTIEFWDIRNSAKDGFRNRCKECRKKYMNSRRENNYEKIRATELEYEKNNRESINESARKRYKENNYIENKRIYRRENREIISKKAKEKLKNRTDEEIELDRVYRQEYYQKNKEKIIKQNCLYIKKKLAEDIQWMLKFRLRGRIKDALKKNRKLAKSFELVGADIEFVRFYLENQFTGEMTWDNHGKIWHIDHIIPICSFDLTILEEQKKCFHYTNLRPLLATDNLKKSADDKLLSFKHQNKSVDDSFSL